MINYKKLQNGSDIRGIALEGVAGEDVNLTAEAAKTLGGAFAVWLGKKTGRQQLRVALGRDSRLSGPALMQAVAQGLQGKGVQVLDCGMASTPAMFMATVLQGHACDGSIMITASHLPFNRNGLKFFTKDGGLEKADIAALTELAEAGIAFDGSGSLQSCSLMEDYAAHLAKLIREGIASKENYDRPLTGLKIALDAGNGAGGFYAHRVLEVLGADVSASRFLEPDGRFPNHIPNPENAEAMAAITEATLQGGCDMGIIFDTDVDRAGAVDHDGKEINRNRLIALISAIVLEENPGATIVTDSVTSDQLAQFIRAKGGVHHRFKRGYKNVINEAIHLEAEGLSAPLAIETSGHAALKENYFLDDGAYLVSKLLIRLALLRREGKDFSGLLEGFSEPKESLELRFKIAGEGFGDYGKEVLAKLLDYAKAEGWSIAPDNYEGVRVSFPQGQGGGWMLLRLSLHDPIMPFNLESVEDGGTKAMARKMYEFLKGFDRLDISAIQAAIE